MFFEILLQFPDVLILIHALRIRYHPVHSDFSPHSDDRFWIYSSFSHNWFRKIIIFSYKPAFWETCETGPKKQPLENVSIVNFITKFILNFSFIYDFLASTVFFDKRYSSHFASVICGLFENHITSGHDASKTSFVWTLHTGSALCVACILDCCVTLNVSWETKLIKMAQRTEKRLKDYCNGNWEVLNGIVNNIDSKV